MPLLSVIVPVYNNEDNIYDLYLEIKDALKDSIESSEIVLVNDGSRDGSTRLLNELAQSDQTLKVIHFDKSYGKTAAIWAGIKNSDGELIALMDAELQSDPKDLIKMMSFIRNNDFVNGRREKWQDSIAIKWTSRMESRFFSWVTGYRIEDTGCPLKLFKREVADSFYLFNGMHCFLPILTKVNGFSVIEVSVKQRQRKQGKPQYSVWRQAGAGIINAIVVGWFHKRVIRYRIKEG